VRKDGQGGVPVPGVVAADLVVVQACLALRVGDRLRGFDRLPAEVELTNPRHPLAGQRVPVVSAYRRGGGAWLVVVPPDGFPARVPVDEYGQALRLGSWFDDAGVRRRVSNRFTSFLIAAKRTEEVNPCEI